ncbi:hypothetical protein HYW43_03655 [Candidatus Daviesbacteria bacterium]|nr:hypothetical protein [Candidatus Daviesbacteria bacterium]
MTEGIDTHPEAIAERTPLSHNDPIMRPLLEKLGSAFQWVKRKILPLTLLSLGITGSIIGAKLLEASAPATFYTSFLAIPNPISQTLIGATLLTTSCTLGLIGAGMMSMKD